MLSARQQHCLRGIGIRLWRERGNEPAAAASSPTQDTADYASEALGSAPPAASREPVSTLKTGDRPRFSPTPANKETGSSSAAAEPAETDENRGLSPINAPLIEDWDSAIAAMHACNACELAQHCTQKVPGVGQRQANLLIVGEGPGHDEDIRGEPFVGRSGQLLDRMLAAIGIAREDVYITNIVKCRPPNNRDPKPEEARQCRVFLEAQIKLIQPRVILSVGRVSAHNLLDTKQPVGKLIRQIQQLPGTDIPVKVTYHPAYLLRNPAAKAVAWQDLKQLHEMLQ